MGDFRRLVVAVLSISACILVLLVILFSRRVFGQSLTPDEIDHEHDVQRIHTGIDRVIALQNNTNIKESSLPEAEVRTPVIGQYLNPVVLHDQGIISESLMTKALQKPTFRSKIGTTISHRELWTYVEEHDMTHVLVIDDAVLVSEFDQKLADIMEQLRTDKHWDVLMLGFSCNQEKHKQCEYNDTRDVIIRNKVIRLRYSNGLRCYVIRNRQAATKLLSTGMIRKTGGRDLYSCKDIVVYGCIPQLIEPTGPISFLT